MTRRPDAQALATAADRIRRRQLAAVHAEAKKLRLDEATYRALLERVTGQRSAKDCTPQQLGLAIAELHRLAGKPVRARESARGWAGKPKEMTPLLSKVEALLTAAHREWAYAHSMAGRMFKVKRLEWLNDDQLHRLVAALQIDANRSARKASQEQA